MKKKEFLTEAKRKAIIADKEKAILESFAKTFNKIKRLDENEIEESKYDTSNIHPTNPLHGASDEELDNVMSAMQMQKENEIPKKFKPMDIVIWKPKKTRWNNDYSVRYGAKAKVIEVLGDMLKIEWLKDPSNLELVGRQMDGNYFTDDFEFADINKNDHEDWGLEARKQQNRFNPEINPYELEENEISENEGNLDDKDLIDNINNLDDSDLGWSKDPNKGLSIYFDWDDVDEDLLLTQLLNLIKKVNPNADLGGKKQSLMGSNILANFNAKLYSASQRSFSAIRGLKDYFEDNLQIFK